jgi:predicted nucleotidyltransferase
MTERDKTIAEELKRRLSEVTSLVDIRVFGSRARGDADEYSDLDIFIEVEGIDTETREKIYDITWEVGLDNLVLISALIFTQDEIENSPLRSSFIVQNIFDEGVRV